MIRREKTGTIEYLYFYKEEWRTFEDLLVQEECIIDNICLSGRLNNYFNQKSNSTEFGDIETILTTKKGDRNKWEKKVEEYVEDDFSKMLKLMKIGSSHDESLIMQSRVIT